MLSVENNPWINLEISSAKKLGVLGYIEVLTHGLCSIRDNFTALRRPETAAVALSNPANVEYQVVRTTLVPGLLKTLQHNKSASFTGGFKLFEISDVVLPDDQHVITETIVGAKNRRKICAVYAGPTSGFEIIHGLVDRIMTLCEVAPEQAYIDNSAKGPEEKYRISREGWVYTIVELPQDDAVAGTYFPGRAGSRLVDMSRRWRPSSDRNLRHHSPWGFEQLWYQLPFVVCGDWLGSIALN